MKVTSEVLAIDDGELSPNASIREDLGADSLDLVTLIWALEEEFGGVIEDRDLDRLTTVSKVAAYISDRLILPGANVS